LRLNILKKLRTASLNSEFTGSYEKKCSILNLGKFNRVTLNALNK